MEVLFCDFEPIAQRGTNLLRCERIALLMGGRQYSGLETIEVARFLLAERV